MKKKIGKSSLVHVYFKVMIENDEQEFFFVIQLQKQFTWF